MTQKSSLAQVKRRFAKFMGNGCVRCIHNNGCTFHLHGKLSLGSGPCPHAEPIPDEEYMMLVAKNVFGLPPEKLAVFEKKMKERLYG